MPQELMIIVDEEEIELSILQDIANYIKPIFAKAAVEALKLVKYLCYIHISTSETFLQLLPGGALYNQVGNPNIEENLYKMLDVILHHIDIDARIEPLTISNRQITAIFEVNILRDDFQDILGMPESSFSYTNKKGEFVELPWLRWLLLGNLGGPIVLEYHYVSKTNANSRTGFGFMGKGGTWNLPTIFQGNINDNFLTKVMKATENTIINTIEQEFQKYLDS